MTNIDIKDFYDLLENSDVSGGFSRQITIGFLTVEMPDGRSFQIEITEHYKSDTIVDVYFDSCCNEDNILIEEESEINSFLEYLKELGIEFDMDQDGLLLNEEYKKHLYDLYQQQE